LGVWELNLFGQIVVSHDLAKQKESSVETLPLPRLELAPPGAGREDARSIRRFAGFSWAMGRRRPEVSCCLTKKVESRGQQQDTREKREEQMVFPCS